ncbi:MAG: methyl-accepting chemotaxis protein, partial [Rhodocyclaceae bacterium]|nr:methyl-accepting chemotaxis protein [Rhodocyclaceae bacterium]
DEYRAYFRWVPQGQWSIHYTLRLNHPGRFTLPATRAEVAEAEALYARMRSDPTIRLDGGRLVRRGQALFARFNALSIIGRLAISVGIGGAAIFIAILIAWLTTRDVQHGYRRFIDVELERRVQMLSLYGHGLQLGQATRNILLDPDNPKAYENHKKASEEFDKTLSAVARLDAANQKSGLPEQLAALRAEQKKAQEAVLALVADKRLDEAKQLLNKEETPKWRALRQALLDEIERIGELSEARLAELDDESQQAARLALAVLIAGALLAGIAAILTLRNIRRTALRAEEAIEIVASGNLRQPIQPDSADEIGKMVAAVAKLKNRLHEAIAAVQQGARSLAPLSQEITAAAQTSAKGVAERGQAIEAIAAAVEELSVSTAEMSSNAIHAKEKAQEAAQAARSGAATASDTAMRIEAAARMVAETEKSIDELAQVSAEIGRVVNVIGEIADQTNLLALNAAIEAARAGEMGRGFAVVADEVRKLAERTSAATGEISAMIGAIQSETQNAIATIRDGSAQARNGAQLARQAADALELINRGAEETTAKVELIAQAAQAQAKHTSEIAELVTNIMALADRNSEGANQTLEEARQLDYLATNLEEVGTIFRLGQRGEAALALHARMPQIVMNAAAEVARLLEAAVDRGEIKLEELFDQNYVPIPNTQPQKYHTRYDGLTDRLLPAVQEPLLDKEREIAYAIACDLNGYVPTHNRRYSQPLTGDAQKDTLGNRTKRIFDDPVGKRCGAHEAPFLLQTYRRDTGEIMHDISAPIYVKGRHWGGFRIGYRTD